MVACNSNLISDITIRLFVCKSLMLIIWEKLLNTMYIIRLVLLYQYMVLKDILNDVLVVCLNRRSMIPSENAIGTL